MAWLQIRRRPRPESGFLPSHDARHVRPHADDLTASVESPPLREALDHQEPSTARLRCLVRGASPRITVSCAADLDVQDFLGDFDAQCDLPDPVLPRIRDELGDNQFSVYGLDVVGREFADTPTSLGGSRRVMRKRPRERDGQSPAFPSS